MSINRMENERGDWIEIALPNHSRDEFSDILEAHRGQLPDLYLYTVTAPYTVQDDEVETRREQAAGLRADAQIDFPRDYAVVRLDAEVYAETPPDDLIEEAEDILAAWAADYRARLAREGVPIEEEPEAE